MAAGCPTPTVTGPGSAGASGGAESGPGDGVPAEGRKAGDGAGRAIAFRSFPAGLRHMYHSDSRMS